MVYVYHSNCHYFNHLQLTDEAVQTTEDEAGLKVPLNHTFLLEVRS